MQRSAVTARQARPLKSYDGRVALEGPPLIRPADL